MCASTSPIGRRSGMAKGKRRKRKQKKAPGGAGSGAAGAARLPPGSGGTGAPKRAEGGAASEAASWRAFVFRRWQVAVAALLLALSAGLPYLRSLDGGFFYDDWHFVVAGTSDEGPRVKPLVNDPSQAIRKGLRGVTFLTYALDHQRGGGGDVVDPRPFHVTNLAIHVLSVLAVWGAWYQACRRLKVPALLPATLAAALFGLHPLCTEAVNYPSARGSPLVLLLSYGVANLVLLGCSSRSRPVRYGAWGAAVPVWVVSIFSKEIGVAMPIGLTVGVLYATERDWIVARLRKVSLTQQIGWVGGATGAALLVAIYLLHPGLEGLRPEPLSIISRAVTAKWAKSGTITDEVYGLGGPYTYTGWNFVWTEVRCFWQWLSLVVFPFGRQNVDHAIAWNDGLFSPAYTPFALLGYLALWVAALVGPLVAARPLHRLALLGVWIALIGILPNFITPDLQPMLEYRWITSLSGVTLTGAAALLLLTEWLAARRGSAGLKLGLGLQAAVVLALLGGTVARNGDWVDETKPWHDSVQKDPTRLRAWNELAMAYYHTRSRDPKRVDKAIEYLERALELNPNYVRGLSNLGAVYADAGRDEDAVRVLERMVESPEAIDKGVIQLGLLYEKLGRPEDALKLWVRASTQLKGPLRLFASAARVRLHVQQQQFEEAVAAAEAFFEITGGRAAENTAEVRILHATALFHLKRLQEAVDAAQAAAAAAAGDPMRQLRAVVVGADALRALGKLDEAAASYADGVALLTGPVQNPGLLTAVGDSLLKVHMQRKDSSALKAAYEKVTAALPAGKPRDDFEKTHQWMLKVQYGK